MIELREKQSENRRQFGITRLALTIGCLYAGLLCVLSIRMKFAILSNDSLPLAFQARHLSLHDTEFLFNGFFPMGYPFLMRIVALIGDSGINTSLMLLQCLLGGTYAALAWVFARRFIGPGLAAVVTVAALFLPEFLRYELSATPDFVCAFLIVCGIYSFAVLEKKTPIRAGFLFGFAALFRTHALVFLVSLVLAELLLHRSREGRKAVISLLIGASPAVLLQGFIQLASGHGFFETTQNFNVWKMMYGEDWTRPTVVTKGALQLILDEPSLFFSHYIEAFGNVLWLFLALFVALLLTSRARHKVGTLPTLFLAGCLYLLIVSVGASARAEFPVQLLALIAIAWALSNLPLTLAIVIDRTIARWLVIGSIIVAIAATVFSLRATRVPAMRVDEYNRIAETLNIRTFEDSRRIFTDDFALYFPSVSNATPITMGGWASVGFPVYQRLMPRINDSSSDLLASSLREADIRYVIVRVPALDMKIATLIASDTTHFLLLGQRFSSHVIYELH